MLFLQPGVDDGVTIGYFVASTRMDHHLLGGLVHGEQLAQVDERFFTRFIARCGQHFLE